MLELSMSLTLITKSSNIIYHRVKNLSNNSTMTYTLVAESEADLSKGKISINSPIGKGLLGKKKGEKAIISVPSGKIELQIMKITR